MTAPTPVADRMIRLVWTVLRDCQSQCRSGRTATRLLQQHWAAPSAQDADGRALRSRLVAALRRELAGEVEPSALGASIRAALIHDELALLDAEHRELVEAVVIRGEDLKAVLTRVKRTARDLRRAMTVITRRLEECGDDAPLGQHLSPLRQASSSSPSVRQSLAQRPELHTERCQVVVRVQTAGIGQHPHP